MSEEKNVNKQTNNQPVAKTAFSDDWLRSIKISFGKNTNKKMNNPNDSKEGDWGDNHHDIKTEKNRFTLVFAFASNG